MTDTKETTLDKMNAYMKYISIRYEKEPFYQDDVKRNDKNVLRVAVYRVIAKVAITDADGNITKYEDQLQYHFALYNINYTQLIAIKDPTGEERLDVNRIPVIYLKVTDKNDSELTEVKSIESPEKPNGDFEFIYDYDATPEKDYKGKTLTGKFLKWLVYTPNKDYSTDLKFDLVMSDKPSDEQNATYYGVITSFELSDVQKEKSKIDFKDFEVGYNSSLREAGYLGYVLKTKLWWQMLIAIVAVGFISGSFYIVWMAEVEDKSKETVVKRKK